MLAEESTDMKLIRVFVEDYKFSTHSIEQQIALKKNTYEVKQRFTRLDNDNACVELKVTVVHAVGEMPYVIELALAGHFYLKDFEKDPDSLFMMKNNTLAILYPYLRSMLSQLTTLAGGDGFVLPIVNTLTAFGDQTR